MENPLYQPTVQIAICQYLQFEDAVNLCYALQVSELICSISIKGGSFGSLLTFDRINPVTISTYRLIKAVGFNYSIFRAIEKNNLPVVKELLRLGFCIHRTDHYGKTALMIAAKHGLNELITFLLETGAQLEGTSDNLRTALFYAASKNRLETVKLLLDLGSNIHHLDTYRNSILMVAIPTNSRELVQLLLARESDPRVQNYRSENSLMIAARHNSFSVAPLLIGAGLDFNCVDYLGRTALMMALAGNQKEMVEYLLRFKTCDLTIRDHHGKTAMSYVNQKTQPDLMILLKKTATRNKWIHFG